MLDDYSRVIAEHAVYVADLDGVVVGVLVLIYEHGQVLMDNVAVSPDHQGQGIGGVLIRYAEQTVESQGYKGIELYTHQRMTENIAMYRSRGYTETERRIEKGYERVYMRKIF